VFGEEIASGGNSVMIPLTSSPYPDNYNGYAVVFYRYVI
jgi:hypothetical protein